MRVLAAALILFAGPGALLADGRTDLDILRARCNEQERQIRTLEEEIESLHSQLAMERRRSRGVVPSAAPASPAAPTPDAAPYTVKSGDTLSSIARRYRTSAETLMKSNGIEDPTRLRVGQRLSLPIEATAPSAAANDPTPAPVKESAPAVLAEAPTPKAPTQAPVARASTAGNYEVQRGDTLYGIARKHQLSIAHLKTLNPKVGDKIIVGQTLAITGPVKSAPASAPSVGSAATQTISTHPSLPAPKPAAKKVAEQPKTQPNPKPKAEAKPEPKTAAKPEPAPVAKSDPAQTPQPEETPAPAPAPATNDPAAAPAPRTISSIIVMDEVSLGDLASKHGTTTEQLNELNNWNYKSSLILARGSEVYVPGS